MFPTALGLSEVLRRTGGERGLGFMLALCLGACVGGVVALLVQSIGRARWALAGLHVLVPVLLYGHVVWAIERAAEISWWAGTLSVWTVACIASLTTGAGLHVIARRWPLSRLLHVVLVAAAALACLAFTLPTLQDHSHTVARFVPHAWLLAAVGFLLWPRAERFTLPAGALFGGAALQLLNARYFELALIFSSLALTCSSAAWQAWGLMPRARPSGAGLLGSALLLTALAIGAHVIVARYPASWASARGHGLLTVLVSSGQRLTDVDRDSHGTIFGQSDCEPLDPKIFPGKHEIPGNHTDENCSGETADASAAEWVRAQEAVNPRPAPYRGDIVIVLIDTLRYDMAMDPSMTTLGSLAREGVVFTRAYTQSSFTTFALTGVLGGKLPSSIEIKWANKLSGAPTKPLHGLAPQLRQLGYDTGIAGGATRTENRTWHDDTFCEGFRVQRTRSMHAPAEDVGRAAVEAWDALSPAGPRLLYVHHLWVHEREDARSDYEQAARDVDRAIGQLREHIGSNALWVVLADHGSEFGEHGGTHHASTLYEELMHVPLIMAMPGASPRIVDAVSPTRFLSATLRAMIAPEAAPALGPYLCVSPGPCGDLPALMALELQDIHLHGLLLGQRKIIRDVERATLTAFDLARDPKEQKPLQPTPPALVEALEAWEERLFGATAPEYFWPYSKNVASTP